MKAEEAAQVLGVDVNATTEARHLAFKIQGGKLQEKLEQASTEGLKGKYREAIQRLEEAYETLELYADSSDLPSLRQDLTSRDIPKSSPKKNVENETKNLVNSVNLVWAKKWFAIVVVFIIAIGLTAWFFGSRNRTASQPILNFGQETQPPPLIAAPTQPSALTPDPILKRKKELAGDWSCISPGTQYGTITLQLDSSEELKISYGAFRVEYDIAPMTVGDTTYLSFAANGENIFGHYDSQADKLVLQGQFMTSYGYNRQIDDRRMYGAILLFGQFGGDISQRTLILHLPDKFGNTVNLQFAKR
jgi:hypothetical protein